MTDPVFGARTPTGGASAAGPIGYVPGIDGLRAIAVLAVLVYHVNQQSLPGGLGGVDLFFVISGFVVTAAIAPRRYARARDLFADFYARRIVRIVPALLLVLLATWLMVILFVPLWGFHWAGASTGQAAFFGVSNIQLARADSSYFALASALNPFLHTWTLGVEEQFYLVFPFLIWFARRDLADGAVPWRVLAAVLVASAASFLLYAILLPARPREAFYLMPCRFWELGAGVALYMAMPLWLAPLRRLGRVAGGLAWAVSFLAVGWYFVRYPGTHLHLPSLVLPVGGGLGLVALACARPGSLPARVLASRVPVAIGLASYSLYLWHWPVIAIMRWTLGLETPLKLGAALLAIAAATAFSYLCVERPLRTGFRGGRLSRRLVLAGGPAALAAGAAASWLLLHLQPVLTLGTSLDAPPPLPRGACVRQQPGADYGDGMVFGWVPCRGGGSTLFILGDSHAGAYQPLGGVYAALTGRRVSAYFRLGCELPQLLSAAPYCRPFQQAAIAEVARSARSGDVVLIVSLHMLPPGTPSPPPAELRRRLAAAARQLRPLTAGGARLLFEAPKPIVPSPPFRCLDWFNRGNPACRGGFEVSRAQQLARRAPVLADLRALAAAIPGAGLWDPFPVLCPSDPCSARQGAIWLYRDDNHLAPAAGGVLAPSLAATTDGKGAAAPSPAR